MAFPARMIASFVDYAETDVSATESCIEFADWCNLVAIYSDVDCFIRFNEPTSKPIKLIANVILNFFFPIKKIYVYSPYGSGKLYAWGEKI